MISYTVLCETKWETDSLVSKYNWGSAVFDLLSPTLFSIYIKDLAAGVKCLNSFHSEQLRGGAGGRVVKVQHVLGSQPRDRRFESRHTRGFLCLKSLGKICTPNVT